MARKVARERDDGPQAGGAATGAAEAEGGDRRALALVAARRDDTDGLDRDDTEAAPAVGVNEVHLIGRLGSTSQERALPSGDIVLTFHLVVDRGVAGRTSARTRASRAAGTGRGEGVDALACAAWTARARRTLRTLEPGSWIEVEGALRRRFRRGAVPPVSFYEVEVAKLRRIR